MLKYGYGNWGSIAEHLCSNKSNWECEKHYKEMYLEKNRDQMSQLHIISFRDDRGYIMQDRLNSIYKFKELTRDPMPVPYRRTELEKSALTEFAGYIPFRRDFEVE